MTDSSPDLPGLLGQHILLRALRRADVEQLRSYVNDPQVMRYSNTFWPIDDERQERWFLNISQAEHAVWFGIVDIRVTERLLIGTCCLVDIDWIGRQAELRIRIGESSVWGEGLGTEAVQLLLSYGFEHLNLERIWLRVLASNVRAKRLYSRFGFREEGCLRRAAFLAGQFEDVFLMGLLRPEWSG